MAKYMNVVEVKEKTHIRKTHNHKEKKERGVVTTDAFPLSHPQKYLHGLAVLDIRSSNGFRYFHRSLSDHIKSLMIFNIGSRNRKYDG